MPVDKNTIIALLNALDSAEKTPRCPCGGRFEGVGYHKGDTVYQCEKCGSQISVTDTALIQKGDKTDGQT